MIAASTHSEMSLRDRGRDSTQRGVMEGCGDGRSEEGQALSLRLLGELARRVIRERRIAAGQVDEVGFQATRGRHLHGELQLGRQRITRDGERLERVGGIADQVLELHVEAVGEPLCRGAQHLLGRVGQRRVEPELDAAA